MEGVRYYGCLFLIFGIMAIQLQTAKNSFARYKHDLTDVDNPQFVEWCDWLNKFAYRYVQGIDPDRHMTETTFSVSSHPETESLPANFDNIQPIGCGFYLVNDSGEDTDRELTQTGHGRRDQGYYFEGSDVIFTGFDGNSQTIKLRYMQNITALTAITDYFTLDGTITGAEIIPDEYLQAVVYGLDTLYTQWDEEPGAESFADARFTRALDEFARNVKRTGGVYSIPSFNSYY